MPSGVSRLRRRIRLQLGVTRKLTVIRWTKAISVGEMVIRKKADEGAEKSCRRRRVRGQRKGRKRSRGGKPRSNAEAPRPKDPNKVSNRRITNQLRLFDYAEASADNLKKVTASLLKGKRFRKDEFPLPLYLGFRRRWAALSARVPGSVGEHCFGNSPAFFLEKHFGCVLKGQPSAHGTLIRWLDVQRTHRQILREIREEALAPPSVPRPLKYYFECAWCPNAWYSSTQTSQCPPCGRRALAVNRVARPRRRGRN